MYKILCYLTVFLIAFLIGGAVVYTYFPYCKLGLTDTVFSGYISAIGGLISSLLGGLIGALVAFGVARYQISADKEKSDNQDRTKYCNILRGLLTELKHNRNVIQLMSDIISAKDEYKNSLETDIWERVRFDAYNFLSVSLFEMADEIYREFKDIRTQILKEYREETIDYSLRLDSIDKLITDMQNCLINIDNQLKKSINQKK